MHLLAVFQVCKTDTSLIEAANIPTAKLQLPTFQQLKESWLYFTFKVAGHRFFSPYTLSRNSGLEGKLVE